MTEKEFVKILPAELDLPIYGASKLKVFEGEDKTAFYENCVGYASCRFTALTWRDLCIKLGRYLVEHELMNRQLKLVM